MMCDHAVPLPAIVSTATDAQSPPDYSLYLQAARNLRRFRPPAGRTLWHEMHALSHCEAHLYTLL